MGSKIQASTFILLVYSSIGCAQSFNEFWQSLWNTPDQIASIQMQNKEYNKASKNFIDPNWRAAALYKDAEYAKARDLLKVQNGLENKYNLANSLAHLNKYEEAISIYDEVLKQNPNHSDAKYNRDLLKKLLDKQNDDKQNKNEDNKGDDQQQNNENKDQNSQNNQDKENKPEDSNTQKQDENKDQNKSPDNSKKDENKNSEPQKNPNAEPKNTPEEQKNKGGRDDKQKANDQWLKLLPDDPGGLLKQQFLRDHLRRASQHE